MFDFKTLNEAKSKNKESELKRNDKYEELYAISLIDIANLKKTNEKVYLEKAVEKLLEAISIRRSDIRAYIKLAYLFYAIDEVNISVKYLKIAKSLDSISPEVLKLQELISQESINILK